MKRILVLGAGNSSPSLISYLLEHAEQEDWQITVGDLDVVAAEKRINGHPKGIAIRFDVFNEESLKENVAKSDLVVNFLAPAFQLKVAEVCVEEKTHMVSASYQNPKIKALNDQAKEAGILILNEMGLDPGMDIMSAMDIITRVREKGGQVEEFISYGSGLPAPDSISNPLKYVITWNPYNVVTSALGGAQYLRDERIKILPYQKVFTHTWPVDVHGVGTLEAYPNRDSLGYIDQFGLNNIKTMIRGTLRYPAYAELWQQMINLGLTNETIVIPDLEKRSVPELVEMCLPAENGNLTLKTRVANYLNISPTGKIMDRMDWLGLFDDSNKGFKGKTIADAMVQLLTRKLVLHKDEKDMVILKHEFLINYPETGKKENIISTFVHYGNPGGQTAMSQTVGYPAAIAAKLILTGRIINRGALIPLNPDVYIPVMKELEKMGMEFKEEILEV